LVGVITQPKETMSLLDKLKANTTIKETAILNESKFFEELEYVTTEIPAINIAFSGKLDGGFTSGLTVLAGPSKHFKTSFALLAIQAYQAKYKDSVCLFYDSEFGTPQTYFDSFGVDMNRVVHTPITDIEQLKFDIMKQIGGITRKDRLIIVIDSIGNLASKKEVDDAVDGKSVADLSRAKSLKSIFRMVTPHLKLKDIPLIVVNHVYQSQETYSRSIVSGGCLLEKTQIQTISGLKSIEEIVVGDIVCTLEGEKLVTHTWTPETLEFGEPECLEIEFEDGYVVTVSGQHPFLTHDGWVDAEDLIVDDEVLKL